MTSFKRLVLALAAVMPALVLLFGLHRQIPTAHEAPNPSARSAQIATLPSEVFFISYPKSGRTWLRWLIGYALAEHLTQRAQLQEFPSQLEIMECNFTQDLPRLRFIHSFSSAPEDHPFNFSPRRARLPVKFPEKDMVFLFRDPRDTIVSAYHEAKYRYSPSGVRPETPEDFILGERGGYKSLVNLYRNWANTSRHTARRHMVLKYEELHLDTMRELRRVFDFLGMPDISDTALREAVRAGSFPVMKWMELRNTNHKYNLPPPTVPDYVPHRIAEMAPSVFRERLVALSPNDTNSVKVRLGEIGSHKDFVKDHPKIIELFESLPCNCTYY